MALASFNRLACLQGALDVLGATLAALLNLSVLKANQPKIARRGLMVLLSANSTLNQLISSLVRLACCVCV